MIISYCMFLGNGVAALIKGMTSVSVTRSSFISNQGHSSLFMRDISSPSFISYCSFHNNTAYGNGGAITLMKASTVSIGPECHFHNNTADGTESLGGALYILDTSLDVLNSSFAHNIAGCTAGAIWIGVSTDDSGNHINTLPFHFSAKQSSFTSNYAYVSSLSAQFQGAGAVRAHDIDSFSISDSSFDGNGVLNTSFASFGGALSVFNGPCDISNCSFDSNSAGLGGGILLFALQPDRFQVHVINSSFSNNWVHKQGGAMFLFQMDAFVLNGSSLHNNSAVVFGQGDDGGDGGALIAVDVDVYAQDNIFSNNFASRTGGDLVLASSTGNVSTFFSGSHFSLSDVGSGGSGGSIYCLSAGAVSLQNCTFESSGHSQDTKLQGGAVWTSNTNLTILSSMFFKNAAGAGGAVWSSVSSTDLALISPVQVLVMNSSFAWNAAQGAGGGMFMSQIDTCNVTGTTFQGDTSLSDEGSAMQIVSSKHVFLTGLLCSSSALGTISCLSQAVPYPPAVSPSPPIFLPTTSTSKSLAIGLGVGLGVGLSLLILLIIALVFCRFSRSADRYLPGPAASTETKEALAKDIESKNGAENHLSIALPQDASQDAAPSSTVVLIRSPSFQSRPESTIFNEVDSWDPKKAVNAMSQFVSQGQEGDRLELFEILGSGSSSTVYRGKWRNLDVAVKTVLFSHQHGVAKTTRQRAITEAGVCLSIVHPNVIATYHYDIKNLQVGGTGFSQGRGLNIEMGHQQVDLKLFLVQELCQWTVSTLISSHFLYWPKRGPEGVQKTGFPEPKLYTVSYVLVDVANGMAYIHSKNIIHGDLKPANVVVRRSKKDSPWKYLAKVTDFGLSVMISPHMTHVSNFGAGTLYYRAPEVDHLSQVSMMSDVYSFGVLMVEIYKGKVSSNSPAQLRSMMTMKEEDVERDLSSVMNKEADRQYQELAVRCLQDNPKSRPTFMEILVALYALQNCFSESHKMLESKTDDSSLSNLALQKGSSS